MKLFERIKQVASKTAGSQKSLGEALGLSGRTFEGYLTESRQDNLWPLLPQILAAYPQIRRDWLYFGEGTMLGNCVKPLQAKNCKGHLVGDLLRVALDYYDISDEDIERHTTISLDELHSVLDSRAFPDFHMLEQLYRAFGIAPAYLFHSNEHCMREAQTVLERAAFALGHESRHPPTHLNIEEWFGASKDEAKEYIKKYKEGRKNILTYGAEACAEKELPTEPALPTAWLEHFEKHVHFRGGWLTKGTSAFLNLESYASAEQGKSVLESKLIAVLEENARLHERIHKLNDQSEETQQDFPKGGNGQPAAPASAALGVLPGGK